MSPHETLIRTSIQTEKAFDKISILFLLFNIKLIN